MSYAKPQTTYEPYRDIYKESRQLEQAAAAEQSQRNANNLGTLVSTGMGVISDVVKRKEGLEAFSAEALKRSNKLNDKVAKFGSPYDDFNKKSEDFFFGLIGEFNDIQSALDNGTHKNPQLARQDLARIERLVDQYKEGIGDVLATGQIIDDAMEVYKREGAGAAGTLSVTGALAPQLNIIDKMRRGGSLANDISISHDGGSIILTDTKTGAILNMDEFNKAIVDKNNPYITLVPDLKEQLKDGYDFFTKDKEGQYQSKYTTVSDADPNNPNAQRYMTEVQEQELIESLKGTPQIDYRTGKPTAYLDGGMFRAIISAEGESIWEDMMPTSITKDLEYPDPPPAFGSPEYEEFYNTFYGPMLSFMSEQTVTENTQDIRRESVEKRMNAAKVDEPKVDADGNPTARELNKELGRDDFDAPGASRLSQRFITSNNIKEDEELIKNAKVGQVVTLSNGKKYKRTLAQDLVVDPGITTDKENLPTGGKKSAAKGNTNIAPGQAVNVQQTIPANNASTTPQAASADNNGYSANVTVDPQTNVVTFDFNGKAVDASKAASGHPVLKMKNDGNDYIRKIGNFETLAGNGSGGSVTGYGFSGANPKLSDKYKNAKGKTNEEKFINTVDSYIIGDNTPGKDVYGNDLSDVDGKPDTSILTDLNMDRATFDALPDDVKKEIVDWKMNTGRNAADIVVIASGGKWDGDKGARETLPDDAIGKVDYKKVDGKKLIAARRAMYKGTLDLTKEKHGEKSSKYKTAKANYDNSQQYR